MRTVSGNVVQHVIAAGHRDCPAILSHFRRLVRLDLRQAHATVESATPLPPDLQASVEAGLSAPVRPGTEHCFRPQPGADRRDAHPGGQRCL